MFTLWLGAAQILKSSYVSLTWVIIFDVLDAFQGEKS